MKNKHGSKRERAIGIAYTITYAYKFRLGKSCQGDHSLKGCRYSSLQSTQKVTSEMFSVYQCIN